MLIRDATEADLPAIVEIYNSAIPSCTATADLEPISVESRLAWFREHTPNHRPVWVMDTDSSIAGWLSFQSFYGRPAYRHTAEISIYVAPEYRRQGVGRQLLKHAIVRSADLDLNALLGLVFAHNHASLKLLEGFGFQRWGYLPQVAVLRDDQRDLVILGLQLSSSNLTRSVSKSMEGSI
ncbi:GNAT family N-acetyltransferase [Leptolyngbya sp. FACHB-261]|uniref:GNAT family N-acetyltransferase n=1 Tax=Leptolyngbya sp. FACHB-261 TaxID=2692806 RepID=UPI00168A3342|nr:GNAT family N-acetyltransferase [Leptolyngbya sp. FACHB-261]MBD2101392.1 N-acetyltransferase [Leptolyngbya sp. FACHB-261]